MKAELKEIILTIIELDASNLDIDDLKNIKRDFAKEYKLKDIPSNVAILREYHQILKNQEIKKDIEMERLLKKRAIRSQSGIVAVQVLTKPFPCPGKCIFCPNEPEMPKSYIKSEPGAMRAHLNQFDAKKQVYNRLLSLSLTGHSTDKIEMIVLGGTWDFYPEDYKIEFVKGLYDACNTFSEYYKRVKLSKDSKYSHTVEGLDELVYSKSLEEAIEINQEAKNRMIGLTVETRPEFVNDTNCRKWRELGVTRLEIGVQSMYDDVLEANKRGHSVQQIREAMHKMRQYGFKFSIHIMPGLYKSSYEKDISTMKMIYKDPFVKPDEIKLYPTSVIPNTELYELYKKGDYEALETKDIKNLIKESFLEIIPPYTRIKRLIRDIPATEIEAGSNITNLSQIVHNEMKKELKGDPKLAQGLYRRLYGDYKLLNSIDEFLSPLIGQRSSACREGTKGGLFNKEGNGINTYIIGQKPDLKSYRNFVSLDTRSREIRNKDTKSGKEDSDINLVIRIYNSSVGIELFVSFEDKLGYLYGFARLLLPQSDSVVNWGILNKDVAMIRELHIYGQMAELGKSNDGEKKQHKGFGTQLMELSEKICSKYGYKKLAVISGIGVRKYYEKLGYELEDTYMVKELGKISED